MLRWLKYYMLFLILLPLFYLLGTRGVEAMGRYLAENPTNGLAVLLLVGSAVLASLMWYGTK